MDFNYLIIAQAGDSGLMSTIVMFGMVFLIFYFILIRPQKKELMRHQELISSLKSGDEVVTTGGIIGKVTKVDGEIVHLEIARGTTMKVARQKIHQNLADFRSTGESDEKK